MRHTDNAFLVSLPEDDREALRPYLAPCALTHRQVLYEQSQLITTAYFLCDAVVSLVVVMWDADPVVTALVGYDGIVGGFAALESGLSTDRAVVQIAGQGFQCDIESLKLAASERPAIRAALFRHQQTLLAHAQQSAACYATHMTETRLARCLLRATDLAGSDALDLTQEGLSDMLGVERSSVSVVANSLQQAGFIAYSRGHIKLLNLEGLRQTACECYATVKMHYEALLHRTAPAIR